MFCFIEYDNSILHQYFLISILFNECMIIPALRSQYKEYGNNLRCLHGSITCIRLKFNTFGIYKRIVGGLKHYEMRMCVCVCFKDTLLRAQTLFSKTSGMFTYLWTMSSKWVYSAYDGMLRLSKVRCCFGGCRYARWWSFVL